MDQKRKAELLHAWKNRRPQMGLVAITCKATGEVFADCSVDTQFAFNRHRFQLSANLHPNKKLQELWQQYGENGFRYDVVKILKNEKQEDNQAEKLTALLEEYLAETPQARRLSR